MPYIFAYDKESKSVFRKKGQEYVPMRVLMEEFRRCRPWCRWVYIEEGGFYSTYSDVRNAVRQLGCVDE